MVLRGVSPKEACDRYNLRYKESYEELSQKQKEVVDIAAKEPDFNHYEIADSHGDITRPYVSKVVNCYPHIIRQRQKEFSEELDELDRFAEEVEAPGQESNANGRVTTEKGDISVIGTIDGRNQYWEERPVKNQLTQEQEEFIDNLSVSDLERKVIRAKVRNPDKSFKKISEMIDEKLGTVSAYISTNRDKIEKAHSLKVQEKIEKTEDEEVEESSDGFSLSFSSDEVIDLLSSDIDRELKEEIFEEITSP